MNIKTKRLNLTLVGAKDVIDIQKSLIGLKIFGLPKIEAVPKWVLDKGQLKIVARLKTGEFMGVVLVTPLTSTADIGGWGTKKYEGQGYARECMRAVIKTLFKVPYYKLTANVDRNNKKAKSLLFHSGFRKIVELKKHLTVDDKLRDIELWELINREY